MITRTRTRAPLAALLAVLIGLGTSLVVSPAAAVATHGSVSRGVVLDIAPRIDMAIAECPVDAATLTWGFKETFRSYISGAIANGEWTVADGATYETPDFGWADGEGSYDSETGEGLIAFTGSITFTGHGDILNTTVANPQLQFVDVDTAILLLDVSGTTQEGEPVSDLGVPFVELDLTGALEIVDGTLVVTDATAVLSATGAAAFGTYPEGEPFDPVTLTAELDGSCATASVVDDPTVPEENDTGESDPASSIASLWWLWVLLALVVIAAVIAAIVIARRRRNA